MTGLTAEAAVERVQSDTRARMLRADRSLSARAPARPRRPRQPAAAPADGPGPRAAARAAARQRHRSWRAPWGRRRCSTTTASELRGLVLEEGGPTSHVAIVARALGIAAVGEVDNATGLVESGRPDHRRRRDRRRACAAAARHRERLCRAGAAARPPAGAVPRAARQALRHQGRRRRSRCMINAGLLVDLPHLAETGADGIGLFRTELQFMIATAHAAHQRAAVALPRRARRRRRPAGDLPHARYRRRQGAALYARRARRRTRRSAGAPSGSASTGRACCAARCARCCRPRPAASCKVMFPMIATVRRVRRGQGAWSSAS